MRPLLRIIIIEDSQDDALLVAREVERAGYTLQTTRVQTAEEMRRALEQKPWDLVLADYRLPDFSAAEGLTILKETGLDIPFIVVSGKIGEDVAVQLMKDGAVDYVMKDRLLRLGPAVQRELHDAEERRKAEAEKESMRAQLLQSQKMEAIGQLAGGVAHDFNNLLTSILGNAAIIRGDTSASDPIVVNLSAIETAARQAADLARSLLTFSRKAVISAVPMHMAEAIDTTLAIVRQSLPVTMNIVRDVSQNTWSVLADPSQMSQVILNLAVNARDAMQGRGTLMIRLRNVEVDEQYVHTHVLARTGEFVHLSVIDTGPGIPNEILEHLFEPFHTTKPAGSGTGLGLSIVYGAVKQAGGWVTAESPETGGTVFDIFLPRCNETPQERTTGNPVAVKVTSGTVLVVEDEPVVCAVADALLARNGYEVLTAADGASALTVLGEHPGSVDLILLDMTMPGMTTDEAVRAIRGMDAHVPILLTSGYTSSDTVRHMLDEGTVQGFLAKPYEQGQLFASVARLLRAAAEGSQ
ncbi:MAG: hybrid sensor histidine kinase/response regulator [Candidatus Cryosericum sp.]